MNTVTCLTCGAKIVSRHRHDYVSCRCPLDADTFVAVDGGNDYPKRAFGPKARWQEPDGTIMLNGEPECKR